MNQRRSRDALLRRSPVNLLMAGRARRRLAVLAYHGIADAASFGRHVEHAQRVGTPITLEELVSAIDASAPLPARPILFTFDDGDPSVLDAAGELHRRGVSGVAFVVTDAVGTDDPLWWREVESLAGTRGRAVVQQLKQVTDDERRAAIAELRADASTPAPRQRQLQPDELRELERLGVAVASHSASHPCLPRVADAGLPRELVGSRAALEGWLGHPVTAFAHPNGDHDERTRAAVAAAGYRVGFAFDHRLSPLVPPDPFAVSRVRIDASASVDRLDLILSGLHAAVHHRLGRR